MTDPTCLLDQQVYFVGSLTVPTSTSLYSASAVMSWGDVLTITEDVLEAGYSRDRAHWLELVDDEQAQIDRYGEVKFGRGSFPDFLPRQDPHGPTLAQLAGKEYVHKVESFATNVPAARRSVKIRSAVAVHNERAS